MRFCFCLLGLVAAFFVVGCAGDDPPADGVALPDLVGLTNREAQMRLEALRLRWTYVADGPVFANFPERSISTGDDSEVVDQDPDAGTIVKRGAIVRLETACPAAEPDCLD